MHVMCMLNCCIDYMYYYYLMWVCGDMVVWEQKMNYMSFDPDEKATSLVFETQQ